MRVVCLLSLLPRVAGHPRCSYGLSSEAGLWGGRCACPDGTHYFVGDNGDFCQSLACEGGRSYACNRVIDAKWSGKRVNCNAPVPKPPPQAAPNCHTPTVAYGFMVRDQLDLWAVWERYFNTCPPGSVLPVVHTQASPEGRAVIERQLAPFGGKLVSPSNVLWGNPRWDFLASSMFFANFRVAGETKAQNGCYPQWIHMATESDLPVGLCSSFHRTLANHPGTSHIGSIGGRRDQLTPVWDVDQAIKPVAHAAHLVTFAMHHALALAHDECDLVSKWRPHFHDGNDHNWLSIVTSEGRIYATPDEIIFYTELTQRRMPFLHQGFTAAWFQPNAEHPNTFDSNDRIMNACQDARREGYFFFRKAYAPNGNVPSVLHTIAQCVGKAFAAPPPVHSPTPLRLPPPPLPLPPPLPSLPSPPPPPNSHPATSLPAHPLPPLPALASASIFPASLLQPSLSLFPRPPPLGSPTPTLPPGLLRVVPSQHSPPPRQGQSARAPFDPQIRRFESSRKQGNFRNTSDATHTSTSIIDKQEGNHSWSIDLHVTSDEALDVLKNATPMVIFLFGIFLGVCCVYCLCKRFRYHRTTLLEPTFEMSTSSDRVFNSESKTSGKVSISRQPSSFETSMPFKVFLCVAYLTLNTVLNLLNKWALDHFGFHFPMILTAAHMAFGFLALLPLMVLKSSYRRRHMQVISHEWRGLLFVGCMNGPQIAVNNASLVTIELSLNQVIRAAIPVCVACFAFCLERKVPTTVGGLYLMLISGSVMLVVWSGNHHNAGLSDREEKSETVGMLLCGAGVLMQSLQMSLAGKVMSSKLDSLQLTFYTGPVALLTLCAMEGVLQREMSEFLEFVRVHPLPTLGITMGGACIALAYNVVLMQSVRSISAVGTAVLGNFRTVFLVCMSAVVLNELSSWGSLRWMGFITTLVGAAGYGLHPKICKKPVVRELNRRKVMPASQSFAESEDTPEHTTSSRRKPRKSKARNSESYIFQGTSQDDIVPKGELEDSSNQSVALSGNGTGLPLKKAAKAVPKPSKLKVAPLKKSQKQSMADELSAEPKLMPKQKRKQLLIDVFGRDPKGMSKKERRQYLSQVLDSLAVESQDDAHSDDSNGSVKLESRFKRR